MTIIDTHSHLYLDDFLRPDETESSSTSPLSQVLSDAENAGISAILLPSISFDSLAQMDELIVLASQSGSGISFHKMAGIHPCEFKKGDAIEEEVLFELCDREETIGVGETGLDGYWSREAMQEQMDSLRIHCKIAKELDKPIVLHNRDTTHELLDIIEEEQDGRLRGVWHCFNGTVQEGKRALDLGLFLGIGGVVTFKNAGVAEVVVHLPLDSMILETDAPYLAPVPFRGKRNEPAYMLKTAEKLAEVHATELAQIARITTQNARNLFRI